MKPHNMILAALLIAITITTEPALTQASTELIANGGFESGNADGWLVLGNVRAARGRSHSGFFSLRFGSIDRSYAYYWYEKYVDRAIQAAQISQSFNLPAGKTGILSFWYMGSQGDSGTTSLRVSLIAQNGTVIAQWDAKIDYKWHQITYQIDSRYAGQALTLRFSGTPSISYEYIERMCRLGRYCLSRKIVYPVYAYVDDISVSYP